MELTKAAIIKVVDDYAAIMDAVPDIIKQSGYRVDYIAKKLHMPKSTFYARKKKRAFFVEDMQKIAALIDDDLALTPKEEAYFVTKAKEAMVAPFVSEEEIKALF
jgi:hypothetical protein